MSRTPIYKLSWKNSRLLAAQPQAIQICKAQDFAVQEQSRMDYLLPAESTQSGKHEERMQRLTDFQRRALLHAFSFPSLERIVYSTCSVGISHRWILIDADNKKERADFSHKKASSQAPQLPWHSLILLHQKSGYSSAIVLRQTWVEV